MKAAVYHGPGDIRVEEIARPALEGKGILLKVRACGICGSDLHMYKHGLFEDLGVPVETGRVLGHEFSGEKACHITDLMNEVLTFARPLVKDREIIGKMKLETHQKPIRVIDQTIASLAE